jgi:hypothetical protein
MPAGIQSDMLKLTRVAATSNVIDDHKRIWSSLPPLARELSV